MFAGFLCNGEIAGTSPSISTLCCHASFICGTVPMPFYMLSTMPEAPLPAICWVWWLMLMYGGVVELRSFLLALSTTAASPPLLATGGPGMGGRTQLFGFTCAAGILRPTQASQQQPVTGELAQEPRSLGACDSAPQE
jgi:hypothetical protein